MRGGLSLMPVRYRWLVAAFALAGVGAAFAWPRESATLPYRDEERKVAARPLTVPAGMKRATFAGGCFWGVEETLREIPGVTDARSGFTGGTSAAPTYETVHGDTTGHVEAVQVVYDPAKVRYADLLTAFLRHHDATTTPRKAAGEGVRYRAYVFTHDREQEAEARATVARLEKSGAGYRGAPRKITAPVRPALTFWPADEYHQRYYAKRGGTASCRL
jgi:peptide-methionine (S)-S-oxide reductase